MTTTKTFRPDWISSPGETIATILREKDITIEAFAMLIGEQVERTEGLLNGTTNITIGVARKLASSLGASVEFWMSREFTYRQGLVQQHATEEEWLHQLPLAEMHRYGWLPAASMQEERLDIALDYFGVTSVAAWRAKYADVFTSSMFRTSHAYDSDFASVVSWLREGERQSRLSLREKWDASRFENALPKARRLTKIKDPDRFLPQLKDLCAEGGVGLAIVRAPSGCRASGATRILKDGSAILQLSFRYLTDDQFWFSFFHEAGHLLLHARQGLFLEWTSNSSAQAELEANEFASRMLVPSELKSLLSSTPLTLKGILSCAHDLGIAPGLVVGQLQHMKRLRHNQFNSLKRRYEW